MSGLDLRYKGQSKYGSPMTRQGWQRLSSYTHTTFWWKRDDKGVYRTSGYLHPTIVVQTKRWWTVCLVGFVKRTGALTIVLGPVQIIFDPFYSKVREA